ncbi:efflux RND transporter periplasmic adaptor subunit [Burkholderia sp. L27(2015)]|uniref:HlyD family secretion protein n=1 Tax=Burkholderia sp. L27(2015) TaxID=1641858 RepID=UPI00131E7BA3|nr:efflux RND transporter periplasmic adaptor subunit [Burkholderia sp. L27(2015)]
MTEKTLAVGTAQPNFAPGVKQPGDGTRLRTRRRLFMALAVFAGIAAIAYLGTRWFAPPSEETDDAYVGGNIVAVTAREAGTVLALHADNTQRVLRGQPLIELDPAMANVQLDAAEAALGRAVRAVRVNSAQVDETGAEIVQAEADLSKAENDYTRRKAAAAAGAISGEDLSHAADAVTTTRAALKLARARQAQATSTLSGTTIETNPQVLSAIAEVRRAAIDASYMQIVAPLSGEVAQRTVQLGQKVAAGTPLMAVVPLDSVWVDANFRETQLEDLRVGQPATITTDVYGGKVVFHGHVAGLGAGSGNAFSLLPPQNATGNWIKIVQRVPVRIALDPAELEKKPLRVGLSVDVEVETADRSGSFVANSAPPAGGEMASLDGGPKLEDRIREIIEENAGRKP